MRQTVLSRASSKGQVENATDEKENSQCSASRQSEALLENRPSETRQSETLLENCPSVTRQSETFLVNETSPSETVCETPPTSQGPRSQPLENVAKEDDVFIVGEVAAAKSLQKWEDRKTWAQVGYV